jgi:hypothetical protein
MAREDLTQISFRIPTLWLHDVDELAKQKSEPGLELSRADILRMAIARGLPELKAEMKKGKR